MINEKLNQLLLNEIKSKKQIENLDNKFIEEKITKFLLTNGNIRKKLETEFQTKQEKITKSKTFKEIVKKIREEIGIVYGSFLTKDFTKKEKLLQNKTETEKLLMLHKSTRERTDFYTEIYKKIFEWYKPKQIADLACGLNPLSYEYIVNELKTKPKYFASDLNPNDMNFLNKFFKQNKIDAVAKPYDITTLEILKDKDFQKCNLIFLFKALDSFEFVKKNISKDLLKGINAKHIVVSFPTKSLVSKQEFKIEKRNWLFNFLKKENWDYETFEIENELFLLINKNAQK